jgi:hypothetical protein
MICEGRPYGIGNILFDTVKGARQGTTPALLGVSTWSRRGGKHESRLLEPPALNEIKPRIGVFARKQQNPAACRPPHNNVFLSMMANDISKPFA